MRRDLGAVSLEGVAVSAGRAFRRESSLVTVVSTFLPAGSLCPARYRHPPAERPFAPGARGNGRPCRPQSFGRLVQPGMNAGGLGDVKVRQLRGASPVLRLSTNTYENCRP